MTDLPEVYEGSKPYLFVSYSHRDAEIVLPIMKRLNENGFRLWYDAGIEAATEWPKNIEDHLKGCSCVLAFLSSNSVASKYCRREINFAVSKDLSLLCIYLEDVELTDGLEIQLGIFQAMFYQRAASLDAFVNSLIKAEVLCSCGGDAVSVPEKINKPTPQPQAAKRAPEKSETKAGRLDDSIDGLSEGPFDLDWCEKVDFVAAMAKGISAQAPEAPGNLGLLKLYQKKAGAIRNAAVYDERIRRLASAAVKDEAWSIQVLELDKRIDDSLRMLLTEEKLLSRLVNQSTKQQKRKETVGRRKADSKKRGRAISEQIGRIVEKVTPILVAVLLVGGIVLFVKSFFVLGMICEAVALGLSVLAAVRFNYDYFEFWPFVAGAAALLLVFVGLVMKWVLG